MKKEENKGAVGLSVYWKYIAAAGGCLAAILILFLYLAHMLITTFSSAWITLWTNDSAKSYEAYPMVFYIVGSVVIAVIMAIVAFLRSACLAFRTMHASNNLHYRVLRRVLGAPTSFFDVTPIGRLISRFSKDLFSMDEELGSYMDFFIFCSLFVISTLAVIVFATPWFGAIVPFIMAIYIFTVNYYRDVNREAKRIESVVRSPVYAHFSETLGGLVTIRAFEDTSRFVETNMKLVDASIRSGTA